MFPAVPCYYIFVPLCSILSWYFTAINAGYCVDYWWHGYSSVASIRNSSNKKVSLKHTQPVQCPFSCLHVQLLWFCRCISLNKSDMVINIYTPLHILTLKGKSGLPFCFGSGCFADTDYRFSKVDWWKEQLSSL